MNCRIFDSYYSEIMSLGTENVKQMDKIIIDFKYFIPGSTLNLVEMVEAIEYSISSIIVKLELQYPFVFSYYGRRLFSESFPWMKRDINELLLGCQGNYELTHDMLVLKDLWKLHCKIQSGYNSLDVMQVISNDTSLKNDSFPAINALISFGDSVGSLRQNAYSVTFFLIEAIEESFVKLNSERTRSTVFFRNSLKRKDKVKLSRGKKYVKLF
ncbi:hypothetical protein CLIB1423_17S01684 [[Candida] railenensis]|uniref:Uncharacterized protein n=1 Tax=[Candida] railenensis TaxID=45579 RepID=A0A9P0QTA9_9ASCO|nr:hypothetical protein CLIB1423_17S01684 [[Candida] railenensis]